LIEIKAGDELHSYFKLVVLHQEIYNDVGSYQLQPFIDETMRENCQGLL